jgi:hypothetical protein
MFKIKRQTIPLFAAVVAVAFAFGSSAFSKIVKTPRVNDQIELNKKFATDYWVYTQTTTGFADTSKYMKVSLASPGSYACPSGTSRPCVYKEATGTLSTKAGLQADLQALSSDANILDASIRKKGS